MKLSVVIPARNEEGCLEETLERLVETLQAQHIPFEIIVADDEVPTRRRCGAIGWPPGIPRYGSLRTPAGMDSAWPFV